MTKDELRAELARLLPDEAAVRSHANYSRTNHVGAGDGRMRKSVEGAWNEVVCTKPVRALPVQPSQRWADAGSVGFLQPSSGMPDPRVPGSAAPPVYRPPAALGHARPLDAETRALVFRQLERRSAWYARARGDASCETEV